MLWDALTARQETQTANDMKSSSQILFLIILTVHMCCGGERCVTYSIAPTLNPGQTGKWHLEREPDSSWPVLHPFSLERRWKHEPALWTFLAPSSMAVNGPQVPYLQLIWILCTSKVLSAKDNDECYASACGFWQSDFKRGRTHFENNTSGFWFLLLFPIPKCCSYCCLVSVEIKQAYGNNAEVEYKLKTSELHHDLTIILGPASMGAFTLCGLLGQQDKEENSG